MKTILHHPSKQPGGEVHTSRRITVELPEAEVQTHSYTSIFMGKRSDYQAGVKKNGKKKKKSRPFCKCLFTRIRAMF